MLLFGTVICNFSNGFSKITCFYSSAPAYVPERASPACSRHCAARRRSHCRAIVWLKFNDLSFRRKKLG